MLEPDRNPCLPSDIHYVLVDAGCFSNGFLVIWCIIKDMHHNVVISVSKKIKSDVASVVAEALALRWSIQLGSDIKLSKIWCAF